MSDKYKIIVEKDGDTIFELETDNFHISQQREIEPVYSVGCLSPLKLNAVRGSEKIVITLRGK